MAVDKHGRDIRVGDLCLFPHGLSYVSGVAEGKNATPELIREIGPQLNPSCAEPKPYYSHEIERISRRGLIGWIKRKLNGG